MGIFNKNKETDKTDLEMEGNTYPDIGVDSAPEEEVSETSTSTIEELTTRFDDYVKESNAREERFMELLGRQNQAVVTQEAPTETSFQPKELPDYLEDPTGYANTLEDNIAGRVQQLLSEQDQKTQSAARSTTIYEKTWNGFQEKHPDLAKHSEFVEAHSGRIIKDLKGQGLDVENYLVNNKEAFISNVAFSVTNRLKELGIGENTSDERPDPAPQANRTGGLTGNTGVAPVTSTDEPVSGFISQLKEAQKTMGIL